MHLTLYLCTLALVGAIIVVKGLDDKSEDFDEFYGNDEFRYRSHRDLKIKYNLVDRDSIPITQASYSTPQLSPSKDLYLIPFNEETIVLITVRNVGRKYFNITHISGYLHAAHSFDFLVENYTERVMNVELGPNSEITLEYRFEPWNGLSTVEYVFSCDLGYILPFTSKMDNINLDNDIGFSPFQSKFANVTIGVYDRSKIIDFEAIFMWILIAAFWSAVAWAVYELFYVPDQISKGNNVLSTTQLIASWLDKAKPTLEKIVGPERADSLIFVQNDKQNKSKSNVFNTNANGDSTNTGNNSNKDDGWLSGTALGGSKSKKNKKKN